MSFDHPMSQPPFDALTAFNALPGNHLVLLPDAPTFTIVGVSEAFLQATYTRRTDLLGKGVREALTDDNSHPLATGMDALMASLHQVMDQKRPHRMDTRRYEVFNSDSGLMVSTVWEPVNQPVLTPDGQLQYIIHTLVEITEQVLVRHKMQQTEVAIRQLADTVPAILWTTEPDGYCSYLNRQWYDYTGQSPAQALGFGWLTVTHPDDQQRAQKRFIEANQQQLSFKLLYRLRRHDGSYRWAIDTGSPRFDAQGHYAGMIGTVIDVHEQTLAEEKLRQSQERLQRALSIRTVGVIYFDLEGNIHDTNEAFERMSGYSHQALVSGQVGWGQLIPQEFMAVSRNSQQEYRIKGENTPYEKQFIRPDGSRWWGLFAGKRLNEGEYVEFVLDITESKQTAQALKEASQRKDEFLAMLAHELRNPLASIRLGMGLLGRTDETDPVRQQTVGLINGQVDHLVKLVDELLDVSRISRGKIQLKLEPVELGALIRDAVAAIRPQYDAQGKQLHLRASAQPLLVRGDATRLAQVVTNLLTNGLRYTGEQGQVWVSLEEKDGQAHLRVADNGIGLAPDQLTAIFELFVQVDVSLARSEGGLGLGLTLVQQLVQLHGGWVQAHSPGLGQGSAFVVGLPLLGQSSSAPMAPLPLPLLAGSAHPRILVIDDNVGLALLLAHTLQLRGYEVHTRHSGREGIQAAEALHPTVILCDIGMPELDGYETARLIRQQPWGQQVVMIAISGYGQGDDKRRSREAGFDAHLIKPIDLEELLRLLAS